MAEQKSKKIVIPRAVMPEQEADVRRRNFDEVPLGLTEAIEQQ